MDATAELRARIRDFLLTRRARIAPGDVNIPVFDNRRRVKGLRREEVAMLAGISTEYYTRLERGDATGASAPVIASVARVLRLNDIERDHLQQLLAAATDRHPQQVHVVQSVRPELQRFLDVLGDVPAYVVNKRLDIVAVNPLGRALYSPMYGRVDDIVNVAWFQFRNETASRAFWPDWDTVADNCVASLRAELGTRPHDDTLTVFIDELRTNPAFEQRWRRHDVHHHTTGTKQINHPVVGSLTLPYEKLVLAADPDLSLMSFNPEPGTATYDAIRILQLWEQRQHEPSEADQSAT